MANARRRHSSLAVLIACGAVIGHAATPGAQTGPDVTAIVARLHAYLDAYEPKLSALVADEIFDQRLQHTSTFTQRRRLVADIGFLRLPGGSVWLAQRSVRSVDGAPVTDGVRRLDDELVRAGTGMFRRAREIAEANARHNLGHPRTMNVPTLPLELLSRRHAANYQVRFDGRPPGARALDTVLVFLERTPGAVVAYDRTRFNTTEVRARVRLGDGALLRAEVAIWPPRREGPLHRITVDFRDHPSLGVLVPSRLHEDFFAAGDGSGEATYSNFRRFQTSGRLVPPGSDD